MLDLEFIISGKMPRNRDDDINTIINRLTQLAETQVEQLARLANQNGNETAPQTIGE